MVAPLVAVAAAGAAASVGGGLLQAKAAKDAGKAQARASDEAIAEQQRQFDYQKELLQPYVDFGDDATVELRQLAGLDGEQAQAQAIQSIEQGPEFLSLYKQGEQAILANASATGGLRGGNTQEALAKFRPQLLSAQISDRYSRLGAFSNQGQSAAAGTANLSQGFAANTSQILAQRGAAQAGASLGAARGYGNAIGGIGEAIGGYYGAKFKAGGGF